MATPEGSQETLTTTPDSTPLATPVAKGTPGTGTPVASQVAGQAGSFEGGVMVHDGTLPANRAPVRDSIAMQTPAGRRTARDVRPPLRFSPSAFFTTGDDADSGADAVMDAGDNGELNFFDFQALAAVVEETPVSHAAAHAGAESGYWRTKEDKELTGFKDRGVYIWRRRDELPPGVKPVKLKWTYTGSKKGRRQGALRGAGIR